MRGHRIVGILLALVTVMMPVQTAQANHFTCDTYLPPVGGSSGVPGVQIGWDINPVPPAQGWLGVCVRNLTGSGTIASVFAAKIYWGDRDTGALGYQFRAGTCGTPSGDCPATLFTTGAETSSPGQITKQCSTTQPGDGVCAGKLTIYPNSNEPVSVLNYPGATVQLDPRTAPAGCPLSLPACLYVVVRVYDQNGSGTPFSIPPI
jgi:hypothetical protein